MAAYNLAIIIIRILDHGCVSKAVLSRCIILAERMGMSWLQSERSVWSSASAAKWGLVVLPVNREFMKGMR